jgi:anti-sigma B factor antagonist
MTPIKVQVDALGPYSLVTLRGEIDASNSAYVSRKLTDLITAADDAVIVELTWLEFCDSSGLNTFVAAARRARDRRIPFEMVGAYGRVATVFGLTNLDKALNVRDNLHEALHNLDIPQASGDSERLGLREP